MFGTSGGGDLNVASGFDATGKGGNLTIETGRLSIRDGSQLLLRHCAKIT
jgi:large exoprotein involved in heme utilization and adhesion